VTAATNDDGLLVLLQSDVVIICVPHALRKSRIPISRTSSRGLEVPARFHPGQLVILESTTYPETTEELLLRCSSEGNPGDSPCSEFLKSSTREKV